MSYLVEFCSIDMNTVVAAVISSVFGTTGLLVFIGRTWVDARIKSDIDKVCKKELEAYRAQLSIETERSLSEIRRAYEDESNTIAADKTLFSEFVRLIPSNGMAINFLRNAHCGPFDWSHFRPINKFLDDWIGPEFEFEDVELESLIVDFREKARKFQKCLSSRTGREAHGLYWVANDFEFNHEELYKKFIEQSESSSVEALNAYELLVRTGRKKFKVVGNILPD